MRTVPCARPATVRAVDPTNANGADAPLGAFVVESPLKDDKEVVVPSPTRLPQAGRSAPRFAFLDGLRGLAAFYVLLHHAALEAPATGLSAPAGLVRGLLRHGHFAVAVFIVLSGYCLMLPVARDPGQRLRGGVLGYLGRRARRIMPPYYAALIACWLLIALVPGLDRLDHARWDRALPATTPGVVVSHLLLVHNLDDRWIFKVDPPMWSVATEWQIYLLFPGLLALLRRYGLATTVAAAFAFGFALAALSNATGNPALNKLCPWYLGLFALGMAGATRGGTGGLPTSALGGALGRGHWWASHQYHPVAGGGRALVLGAIALVLAGLAMAGGTDRVVLILDLLIGTATAALITRCAHLSTRGERYPKRLILQLLEPRWLVGLGSFSYSLYLIHFPILAVGSLIFRAWGWGAELRLGALLLVVVPLCLVAAYGFHRAFERGFLPARENQVLPAAVAITSGAAV